MRLQQGLDLLFRRIEEWTEEGLMIADLGDPTVEAFGEYGADLVACLQDVIEEMELGSEELGLSGREVPSRELCEELSESLVNSWERMEFSERPVGLPIDELRGVLMAVASVLEVHAEDGEDAVAEAVEQLDEFLADL